MSETWRRWRQAMSQSSRVSARWAYPHDLSQVRAEGKVIAYSEGPQVLIETDDGEQVWWRADLTFIEGEDDE